MSIKKYREKHIEAIEFTGLNWRECLRFIGEVPEGDHKEVDQLVINDSFTISKGDYLVKELVSLDSTSDVSYAMNGFHIVVYNKESFHNKYEEVL